MSTIDDDIHDLKAQPASAWGAWFVQRVLGGAASAVTILSAVWKPTAYMLFAFCAGNVTGGSLVAEPTSAMRGWLERHSFVSPIPIATPVVYNDGSQQVLGQLQRIAADLTTKTGQLASAIAAARERIDGLDINVSTSVQQIRTEISALPAKTAAAVPKPTKMIVYENRQTPAKKQVVPASDQSK